MPAKFLLQINLGVKGSTRFAKYCVYFEGSKFHLSSSFLLHKREGKSLEISDRTERRCCKHELSAGEGRGDGVKTKKRSWRPSILSLHRELHQVAANPLRSARWRTAANSPAGLVALGARAWTSRPMASSRCASSPATMTTLWKSSCSRSVPACLLGLSFGGLHPTRILWACAPCGWHAHSDAPHKLPAGRV